MEVSFKFTLDQKVLTPFGEAGIILMLGVDDGGVKYFVTTSASESWFKESQLSA